MDHHEYSQHQQEIAIVDNETYVTIIFPKGSKIYVKDADVYSGSNDLVFAGNSTSLGGSGEGFIMRVDDIGVVQWGFIYSSSTSNDDFFEKVRTLDDTTYAVVGTNTSSDAKFHLLRLDAEGAIMVHQRVGDSDATYVLQRNSQMIIQNSTFIVLIFRTIDQDLISIKDLQAGTERMFGFENRPWGRIFYCMQATDGDYYMIQRHTNNIYASQIDSETNKVFGKSLNGTDGLISQGAWVYDIAYDSTFLKLWLIMHDYRQSDNRVWLSYVNFGGENVIQQSYSYQVRPFDSMVEFASIHYISESE